MVALIPSLPVSVAGAFSATGSGAGSGAGADPSVRIGPYERRVCVADTSRKPGPGAWPVSAACSQACFGSISHRRTLAYEIGDVDSMSEPSMPSVAALMAPSALGTRSGTGAPSTPLLPGGRGAYECGSGSGALNAASTGFSGGRHLVVSMRSCSCRCWRPLFAASTARVGAASLPFGGGGIRGCGTAPLPPPISCLGEVGRPV
eukprot:5629777-Prymnesium_polylepis.1